MNLKNDFSLGLLKEIELRKNYTGFVEIHTIYFGGGTPSLLTHEELNQIFSALHSNFEIAENAEITFEANPDDITPQNLLEWRKLGINRLSLGVQSFYEDDLVWMNRAHSAGQALDSIRMAQAYGFDNLTIDLIYGSPGLTDEKWKENVNKALALKIPHLSCYALTVEPSTALNRMIETKKSPPVHSEDQARQFLLLMEWMAEAGYDHYEISNFSLPGMHSRHNSAYWSGESYLGLGPSAHSYDGISRQWNVANNAKYIAAIKSNELPAEVEILDENAIHNEYVMIALRKKDGISKADYENRFGAQQTELFRRTVSKYLVNGSVLEDGDSFRLTSQGKLFADGIAADLFL